MPSLWPPPPPFPHALCVRAFIHFPLAQLASVSWVRGLAQSTFTYISVHTHFTSLCSLPAPGTRDPGLLVRTLPLVSDPLDLPPNWLPHAHTRTQLPSFISRELLPGAINTLRSSRVRQFLTARILKTRRRAFSTPSPCLIVFSLRPRPGIMT